MVTTKDKDSLNFLHIVYLLKGLLEDGLISQTEYEKAKLFYQEFTGSDIVF